LQQALGNDPHFIIAGRCSDAALYAALPLMRGFPAGPAWHAGKIVECGTLACETMGPGVMVVTLREDSFSVRPIGPELRCTPQSVAAHSLYETANPAWVETGPAYRFCLNHVLLPREGETVHRLRQVELGASSGRLSGLSEVAP
jgi:hypothetical protein